MRQLPNLQYRRLWVPEFGRFVHVRMSTRALRSVTKLGFLQYCQSVGIELSDGGVWASSARITGNPRARLVQGSLLDLPFANASFDGAFSYGVVHHTDDPPRAMREIARALKPGAPFVFYVYEDFSTRGLGWRVALSLANVFRRGICRMSPPVRRRQVRLVLARHVSRANARSSGLHEPETASGSRHSLRRPDWSTPC